MQQYESEIVWMHWHVQVRAMLRTLPKHPKNTSARVTTEAPKTCKLWSDKAMLRLHNLPLAHDKLRMSS